VSLDLNKLEGFEWDSGNLLKNPAKHHVSNEEAEEVFFRSPIFADDTRPTDIEPRWFALGETEPGRVLRVVFTIRGRRIRVISARPASKKERINYERLR
jgi:hypothetical protein